MTENYDSKNVILRIGMWSGPRNISTAMMRSWENRSDTLVVDEPFYSYYLNTTGVVHPMNDEVIASQSSDWEEVVRQLLGPVPSGISIYYMKLMTHHFLDEMDRDWLAHLTHVFLIRHPRDMVVSLDEKTPKPKLKDTGFPQQLEIFRWLKENTNQTCPIIDSKDLLMAPEKMLRTLCQSLGIKFSERMLEWPAGPRDSDGVWAPHWYGNVEKSTHFASYKAKQGEVRPDLKDLLDECMPYYEELWNNRLVVS